MVRHNPLTVQQSVPRVCGGPLLLPDVQQAGGVELEGALCCQLLRPDQKVRLQLVQLGRTDWGGGQLGAGHQQHHLTALCGEAGAGRAESDETEQTGQRCVLSWQQGTGRNRHVTSDVSRSEVTPLAGHRQQQTLLQCRRNKAVISENVGTVIVAPVGGIPS